MTDRLRRLRPLLPTNADTTPPGEDAILPPVGENAPLPPRLSARHAMAHETALHGVTINCLCPGWTNTSLLDWDVLGGAWGVSAAEAKAKASAECLQNRIIEPDELGPMAVLIASDAGHGITGQVLSVDGGYKV